MKIKRHTNDQISDQTSDATKNMTPTTTDKFRLQREDPSIRKSRFLANISLLILFLAAFLVALILTSYVFQQYEVDGPSMQTTLHNQDRLIVDKIPRTWARITGHSYIPNRGDIIIFNEFGLYGSSPSQSKQLIKRVIGLPGDRIVIKDGVITVYDNQHPNGFDPDKSLSYGKVIGFTSTTENIVVPAGDIFVCGDNRPDSYDSRFFGPVPVKNIIGKLVVRIYPFNTIKLF